MALSVLPPVIADISNAINSAQTVLELIDREPAVNSKGGLTLPQCEGKIELKDVTFAYSSHPDVPVLERVNFVADAKSHVAILGNKRSGKSTLIALIERFFDAQEGLVLLDDTDISTFDPVWLHHQIAFLPQDPVMFSASVKDNICFGQHLTQEKIEDAAKVAKLHQPILRLPDAYDTLVESSEEKGERRRRDVQLSQMMQHKIAIARAVAKDCSIWLIDDFGSSLPESSRAELYEILQEIIPGKTVISTSSSPLLWGQAANKVGVLVHGRIEEWGEPNELRMRQGLYSSLMRGEELGGQGGSSSARNEGASRARQLIDTFELNLTLSQPPEGPALDSLRRVIEEFRATT
ncbi:hypothetical protein GUITHDRAFT_162381 [Guillardia theta CCMP2712]|uniref:ABC transporter domain-containing protein n=1 Tax=Guillardia theta (strain CCMP2712) TaxID=905079 RepID=L1JJ01_GUITC|nr:hypothetical protein GUITHDRAFT_162381 [Guillardia theta CCMP2712]EKX48503.1 hypothetical protein GUITHDRAFT_162381 [Guillardia theta CCMP2712]|eukprot:XP_005835483.1 hypothetical protein GUITHDRAFT_162381 [Guillardia theta CCMP2712]